MKKMISALLAAVTALSLAACGSPAHTQPTEQPESVRTEPSAVPEQSGGVWKASFVAVEPGSLRAKLRSGSANGEELTYISTGVIADETPEGVVPEWPEQYWVTGPILVRAGLDGNTEILPYTPERPESGPGVNSGVLFERLSVGSDGSLWLIENRYRIDRENGASSEERALVHLGKDGKAIASFPIRALAALQPEEGENADGDSFSVPGMADDGRGRLCLAIHEWSEADGRYEQSDRICILDAASGALIQTVGLKGEIAGLTRYGDGKVAVASYRGSKPVIARVDTETGELTELAAADDFLTELVGGTGENLYYGAGDSFYRLRADTGEAEKLFDWSACDVARGDGDSVCVLADGRVVLSSGREGADGWRNELILLSQVSADELPVRKTLRMAVLNLYPYTSEMVSRFNRAQTEYRIEITDYSRYNDYTSTEESDWNAGLTRLQTELIAGNVPDLIDVSLLPVSRLGDKGMLEDLLPYIDSDPELSREQLNMHVLEAFEEQGRLYQTVSNYYVLTTLGLSAAVGERMGWTMEEFTAAMRQMQAESPDCTVFDVYTTRSDALTSLLYLKLSDYVDWSAGTCSFDSDSFKQLLTFVHSFPTSYDWGANAAGELDSDARMLSGRQLMKQCSLACFEDVEANTAGLNGAPCCFVGYPTEEGVGSMFAQIGDAFAISSSCAEKEAAWAFVRQYFLPDYQEQLSGSVFPTNLRVYEEMKREAQSPAFQRNPDGSYVLDGDGKRIEAERGIVYLNGREVKLHTVTAEQIALVEQVVGATTRVLSTDSSLNDILVSGAAAFFADQRSVEDTVRQIQSRATIYINERR